MIENRTAGNRRKKRRYNLLTSDGPFPSNHNILQFYSGGGRGELLKCLLRHVQNCDEPVLVTGEHGSGKTLLSLVLADRLKKKFTVCRYDFPTLTRDSLVSFLVREIKPEFSASKHSLSVNGLNAEDEEPAEVLSDIAALETTVARSTNITQPYLVLIDTPAELDSDLLNVIEQLKAITLNGFALFNIVIFQLNVNDSEESQPDITADGTHRIDQQLVSPWPYKSYNLRRLSLAEIHDYLQHHMMLFDYSQRDMFSREMSYFIADKSEGVYGTINEIARSAFLLAGINNSSQVSLAHLVAVSTPQRKRKKRSGGFRRMPSGLRFSMLVAGIVVLGAALVVISAN